MGVSGTWGSFVCCVGRPDRKERPGFFLSEFRVESKRGFDVEFL